MLSEKLINVINLVKLEGDKSNNYKSLFKFIINKMHIFKCMDLSEIIYDIEKYFPYYNKKYFQVMKSVTHMLKIK